MAFKAQKYISSLDNYYFKSFYSRNILINRVLIKDR